MARPLRPARVRCATLALLAALVALPSLAAQAQHREDASRPALQADALDVPEALRTGSEAHAARMEERAARMEERAARMEERAARMEERAARMEEHDARMEEHDALMEEHAARMEEHAARARVAAAAARARAAALVAPAWYRAEAEAAARTGGGATITVNTLDGGDDGTCHAGGTGPTDDCSLREAVNLANSNGAADIVAFSVAGTIAIEATVVITSPVRLDGATAPGGAHAVFVDASSVGADAISIDGAGASGSEVRGLVIGRSPFDGVSLSSGVTGALVAGNHIGTNTAGDDLGNGGSGVVIFASDNTVGGAVAGEGNTIGFNGIGVVIGGFMTTGNAVLGNYIGTNAAGDDLGNDVLGVFILSGASDNVVGGAGAGNTIGFNINGVRIDGSGTTGNAVVGNYIGTNAAGDDLRNSSSGVFIRDASDNAVGGAAAGEGNTIGFNRHGVSISSGATGNAVAGNHIGTNAAGDDLGNDVDGVVIDSGASDNAVGGAAAGNTIGFNGNGVLIEGSGTTGNAVLGNHIGTNAAGDHLGNGLGVIISSGASDNTVGGTEAGAGNTIGINGSGGVFIQGLETTGNAVMGNHIGTNAAGDDLGNGGIGVDISFGASDNAVGGAAAGEGNTVGFNGFGVLITTGATGNAVLGNHIGTNAAGDDLGNDFDGVFIGSEASDNAASDNAASDNAVGGAAAGEGNTIGFNAFGGVTIGGSGTTGNAVAGNHIGTNAAGDDLRNGAGVFIYAGASDNAVGGAAAGEGNTIGFNGTGVLILGLGTTGNAVLGNAIFENYGLGIDLSNDAVTANDGCGDADSGSNGLQNFPVLASATAAAGATTVAYDLDTAPGPYRVEFFAVEAADPSGHGEGRVFLGAQEVTVAPGCAGSFVAVLPATAGGFVTATATPVMPAAPGGSGTPGASAGFGGEAVFGGTSEFSAAFALPGGPCPETLIISDFAVFADGNSFELRNTGLEPASLAGCSFVATYNDVYVALDLGDGSVLPGEAVSFTPGEQFRNVFGGLALLDREEVPAVGTSIAAIVDDLVASLVYLGHDVVYGFYHRDDDSFEAQCLDYTPMRLHSFAQSQCAPVMRNEGEGPVALSHADLTEAVLAAERGATAAEGEALPTAFALSAAYPNPMAERGTLTVEVPAAAEVRVVVYDVLGRSVAVLLDEAVEAGRYAVALDASSLAPGTYLVRLVAGGFAATQRVTVVR